MDYSPPSSSVHGTSQLRILECVGIFSSRGSSWPRDGSLDSCIADSSPLSQQRSPVLRCAKSLQSCRTLCSPMDSRLPGSSVHGILQARLPKWVVISFSGGPSWPRDQTCVSWIGRWILGGFFTAESESIYLYLYHLSLSWERAFNWLTELWRFGKSRIYSIDY